MIDIDADLSFLDKNRNKQSDFMVFCLYALCRKYDKISSEVFELLDSVGGIDYLFDHYDVLHTQGELWLVAEMEEYLAERGVVLYGCIAMNKNLTFRERIRLGVEMTERSLLTALANRHAISPKEAMRKLSSTQTYKWLVAPDDHYGIAREGIQAVFCRVVHELDTGDVWT